MRDTVTVLVCHVPTRPIGCLVRTLESLKKASTKCAVKVEIVVQGPVPKEHDLPSMETLNRSVRNAQVSFEYFFNDTNTGVAEPLASSTERWLAGDGKYWAKVDDDVVLADGSFDTILHVMDVASKGGKKIGCVHMNIGGIGTTLLSEQNGTLVYKHGSHEKLSLMWGDVHVVDFVGTGATIFSRLPFENGCRFDPEYKIGGVDVDMAWQMTQKGIRSVLMLRPGCRHDVHMCSPGDYVGVRWDPESINRSGQIFLKKWGIENPQLKR
jgi:GT2 family glycosyltransferase